MSSLLTVFMCLMILLGALRQIRANRRRGIGIDWPKTLVSAGGCILVTLVAIGCLLGAAALGNLVVGVMLFVVVLTGGLIGLVVAVNRHWPAATGEPPPTPPPP
jgi:hypothetical protein